jgi:hypothetical protein
MSVLATLLLRLSLLAGIIFLILCVANKIQKKTVKPQYSKGLIISVIALFFSFMLVLIFTPTQTETKKESKPKKKVETVTSTPESTDTTTTTDDNSPTEEERINKFVEEAKTVTQGSVGENEQITGIEYNNRELRVYVDLSQATPDPLTYEDLAISRTSSITDQLLTLNGYFELWNTITVDFGDIGYIKNPKQNMEYNGYGFYFNSSNFQLEK